MVRQHGNTEFKQIGRPVDELAGNKQDGAGQNQAALRRAQDDELRQYPLVLVDAAAYVAAGKGDDEIRQQVDAQEIADYHILVDAAYQSRNDTDALAVMKGHEDDEKKYEVRLGNAVAYKGQDGALQDEYDERRHKATQLFHKAAAPLIPSTLSRFVWGTSFGATPGLSYEPVSDDFKMTNTSSSLEKSTLGRMTAYLTKSLSFW